MSLGVPLIAAQVDAVLAHDAQARVIAIRAGARGAWPLELNRNGRRFRLQWCDSTLAAREAVESSADANEGLVLLTPLSAAQLGHDLIARLSRARVFQPEGWEMVRQMFRAREADARLARFDWMPQALLDAAGPEAYAPVSNGFLDLESAWRALLERWLRLPEARPDAVLLLRWSMDAAAARLYAALPEAARPAVASWIAESAGVVGRLVMSCVDAGHGLEAVPLGLVCGVVFSAEGEGEPELAHAAIRIERFIGDQHLSVAEGRAWAETSRRICALSEPATSRPFLERADSLLHELRIESFAGLSDLLPSGLDQRMRTFAAAQQGFVAVPDRVRLERVEKAAAAPACHVLAGAHAARVERVTMAQRLARWLVLPATAAQGLAGHLGRYADAGAWVDRARLQLLGGDDLAELSLAYLSLRQAVRTRMEDAYRDFALALQRWNAAPSETLQFAVPVERVIEQVLAPLAVQTRVLLLVVDGLSVAVFRELFDRPDALGWQELIPEAIQRPLVGLAALPTITEVSRSALLSGRLGVGVAAQEKAAFAAHAALLAPSRASAPPLLFHKGELSEAGGLSQAVRDGLASPQQRVIGIVYNAVDDQLSGSDQLHQRWKLDDLRGLTPLLREARQAGRCVVVTADHGHVLEDGTRQRGAGDGDRWRVDGAPAAEGELVFERGRVRTASGSNRVVCVWSESLRHGAKKNGYHGGASPQEVCVPLSVFAPIGMSVQGWTPAPPQQPDWWDLAVGAEAPPPPAAKVAAAALPRRRTVPTPQAQLFDAAETPAPAAPVNAGSDWIAMLIGSAAYAAQRQLAARVAPGDEQMRMLLEALASRGGKLSRAALAQRLGLPELRIGGLINAARRVLNVDQAQVLTLDQSAGTIMLNRELLIRQFDLRLL